MLALCGLLIVMGFMTLIMTKKMSPFTALVLVPLIIGSISAVMHYGNYALVDIPKFAIAGITSNPALKITGVANTAIMLLFAILYFGLMLAAGLFKPLVNLIIKSVKGDPLKVLIGTAILSLGVSMDGDGSTTTLVVCSAMLPIYRQLNLKIMHLAVVLVLSNTIMNLLPWGGPTARIIAALHVDEGELLRAILPGMAMASIWVIIVATILGFAERKRLGISHMSNEAIKQLLIDQDAMEDKNLVRPKVIWFNFFLTMLLLIELIFGGMWILPKINSALLFAIALAIALVVNYPKSSDQRDIIEKYGSSAVQVIFMVLAAGIFMGILTGTGMGTAMGEALIAWIPKSFGSHWPLIVALTSIPGTVLLSNDAFYLGVLPVLNQVGIEYGFTPLNMAIASTAGQAFHHISPLVGYIYLLLQITGVEMGKWQLQVAKWATGIFVLFALGMFTVGGVPF